MNQKVNNTVSWGVPKQAVDQAQALGLWFGLLIMAAIATVIALMPVTGHAQEAFDPGVAAPKVPVGYYKGAEKAVYHVTVSGDERSYLGILGSVRNHGNAIIAAGQKPDIKVVINGDGIRMLTLAQELEFEGTARLPGAIRDAKDRGVQFQVCYNTLVGYKIAISQLYETPESEIVLAGVAEVGRLQKLGYALIKP